MQNPPFKLASPAAGAGYVAYTRHGAPGCCDATTPAAEPAPIRARLGDMEPHLHCSVIGTCLSTAELRKLLARFLFVRDCSDLEVHHEAVRLAAQGGAVAKALHKALDHRHDAVVQRYARAPDDRAIESLWDEAMRHGEVPGAYWAVLTHRGATPELRQKAFGDVHMLSHLVGAANRADIRRLVALERDNEELRERAERQQLRAQEAAEARERSAETGRAELAALQAELAAARREPAPRAGADAEDLAGARQAVVLQTERRERAEQAAAVAAEVASRLKGELAHLARHVQALNRELAAAETQLHEIGDGAPQCALAAQLQGKRVFYVGGRPSSTPAIRALVLRHGAEFQHHDGGLEDRKGLLASGVAWAHLVVFPVDCIDHDSAGNLKRLCARQGVVYLPMRGATVASLAAALASGG